MPAYYVDNLVNFLKTSDSEIRSSLDDGYSADGFASLFTPAMDSWRAEIGVLKRALSDFYARVPQCVDAGVLLEFWIPRRLRRADIVLLIKDVIVVVEFKAGESSQGATSQVEDYALDLADFHGPSRGRLIVPVVLSDRTRRRPFGSSSQIQTTQLVTEVDLAGLLAEVYQNLCGKDQLNVTSWNLGQYNPVPTILEAARAMFANMEVRAIASSDVGAKNLTDTVDALRAIVENAKARRQKIACFITGVPGAGKTLAGLRVVHDPEIAKQADSCLAFLSGNGPLVDVLQAALTEDQKTRKGLTSRVAKRDPETLIQGVYVFKKTHWNDGVPPPERIIVFDEAQRAWDQKRTAKKLKAGKDYPHSEPSLLLDIMGRHEGWSVVVALIGGGQEIHEGEAGLGEWGRALAQQPIGKWEVVSSPEALDGGDATANTTLLESVPDDLIVTRDSRLHLDTPTRQFRGKTVAGWVNALVTGKSLVAREALLSSPQYPIYLCRDLEVARNWLRSMARGSERYGLVASSTAGRLRAYGIETSNTFHKGIPIPHWFLRSEEDYRSSYRLEVATTEFEIQGLELDWVGVCWGGDMLWNPKGAEWDLMHLHGPNWTLTANEVERRYTINTYRVLMTRARKGMVIFVPPGKADDSTLLPEPYNHTATFLMEAGCRQLNVQQYVAAAI